MTVSMDDLSRAGMDITPEMETVLKALQEQAADNTEPPDRFTTSLGIVFKLKPVPPFLVMDAQAAVPMPTPPLVHIKDKDTDEENLDDPEYRRQQAQYIKNVGEVANAIMLTRGTEVLELPDGVEPPEGENWAEDVREFTRLEIPSDPKSRRRRYLWMKYVALVNVNDFTGLLGKVQALGGITLEREVQAAAENFRGDEGRDTTEPVRAAEESGNGDTSQPGDTGGSAGA